MKRLVLARLLASLALATLAGGLAACSQSSDRAASAPSRETASAEQATASNMTDGPTAPGGDFAPESAAPAADPDESLAPAKSATPPDELPVVESPAPEEPAELSHPAAEPPPPPPPRRYGSAAPPAADDAPDSLPAREIPRELVAADDAPRGGGMSLPRMARSNPLRATRLRAAEAPVATEPPPPPLPAPASSPPLPRSAPAAPSEPPLDDEPASEMPVAAPEEAGPASEPSELAPESTSESAPPPEAAGAAPEETSDAGPVDSAPAMAAPPELPTDETPTTAIPAATPPAPLDRNVRVFYGTDRRALDEPRSALDLALGWVPGALAGTVAMLCGGAAWIWPTRRRWLAVGATTATALAGFLLLRGPLTSALPPLAPSEVGVEYGADRGRLTMGYCEVSIPPRHDPGEVESPSILRLEVRPDVERHVVLRRVERAERDEFLEAVRERVAQSPRRDLFLFVHGYNVSFEDAARRTAQMAFDLRFQGAPIFFSWPSQAQLIKYTVDENNVAWAVPHLKEFLLDIVQHTDAKSVNLIAHSMGNRALLTAIRELEYELRREETLFNEVVLAAPDIDADVFRRDIAPALRRAANHSTLYASAHDQALVVSKIVHGYPRAGDTGEGLVLVDGVETIDVSRVDLSLLGHSYYGSSEVVLDDLAQLLNESRRAGQRPWLRQADRQGTPYWIFREVQNARRSMPLPR